MSSSVVKQFNRGNGNVSLQPTTLGLDVADAAYHTAHSYPGGVPALAQRMGMSQNTMAHKVGLNNTTHHLTLREAVAMQEVTGDVRILHAMASALGYSCISLRADAAGSTLTEVMHMAKEFGDVLQSINRAVDDGAVNQNEMMDCEQQAAELMAAINSVLATVRGLMPKAPQA